MRCTSHCASAAAAVVLVLSCAARGDVFEVNSFADGNDGACNVFSCTLREAVILTTGTGGADVIELDAGVYTLTLPGNADSSALSGDLDVNFGQVTIQGMGMGVTIIDGGDLDRVFEVGPLTAATLILRDLTVRNGLRTTGIGGGILSHAVASLALERVEITGCQATDDGGGLSIIGAAQVSDSIIAGNSTTAANGNGGGVYVHHSLPSPAVFTRTRIQGNTALNGGAAIFYSGPTQLIDCTLSGNTGQAGNAVLPNDPFGPSLIARGSTFQGSNGLMLLNGATTSVQLENCTLSGNSVSTVIVGAGGGTLSMTNCTVTANSGGGVQRNGGTANIKNSIIAGNGSFQISGTITSQGYNLFGSTAGATVVGNTTGNIVTANAMLGPLADNGGPTQTHALLPGSPAMEAANPADFPAADQRGVGRPVDGDANGSLLPDIGAFEFLRPIPGDLDGDGDVDVGDLLSFLAAWGACPTPCPPFCPADLDDDCNVDVNDLLSLLADWTM